MGTIMGWYLQTVPVALTTVSFFHFSHCSILQSLHSNSHSVRPFSAEPVTFCALVLLCICFQTVVATDSQSGVQFALYRRRTDRYCLSERTQVSFLLHLIAYSVLTVIILTLLTLFTRGKTDKTSPPPLGEWPEDKATHVNRVSGGSYSSARRDLQQEQERRRAG
jgi:ABC-type Fe3+ transport system permease subunit